VKGLRAFLDRFSLGNRPPSGPLTTQETSDAEALRQKTIAEDNERREPEQEKSDDSPSP
jgi:hypothetical protein